MLFLHYPPAKNSFHSPPRPFLFFLTESRLLEKKITDTGRNQRASRACEIQMGRNINSCKGLAEIAVVELAERDHATVGKRIREVGDGELDLASAYDELRNTRRRVHVEATASVSQLDGSANSFEEADCAFDLSPLRSCNTFADQLEDQGTISDLEGQRKSAEAETVTVTFYVGGRARNNTSLAEGSDSMESTAGRPWTEANSRGGPVVHEMPLDSEIEEFFTAAEQDLQKRFSEKYNFDAKNGVPLEGRYEWVREHHEWQ